MFPKTCFKNCYFYNEKKENLIKLKEQKKGWEFHHNLRISILWKTIHFNLYTNFIKSKKCTKYTQANIHSHAVTFAL